MMNDKQMARFIDNFVDWQVWQSIFLHKKSPTRPVITLCKPFTAFTHRTVCQMFSAAIPTVSAGIKGERKAFERKSSCINSFYICIYFGKVSRYS